LEPPPDGARFDEAGDATRRTRLANERTYLAWWRTGLTALAVALGAGKLIPELTDSAQWPFVGLGIGFAVLGVGFIAYGQWRARVVEEAVRRGEFVPLGSRFSLLATAAGVGLGIATIVIMAYEA